MKDHRPRTIFLLAAIVCAVGLVVTSSARADLQSASQQLAEALRRELGLTRSSADVRRGLEALDHERASLEYTTVVLDHAGRESMRKLASYREVAGGRTARAKARARALYKLARGGAARLVFEPDPDGSTAKRILAGRTLRRLVLADLAELDVHRRASERARAELVAAAREVQALGGVAMIESMQRAVLERATDVVDVRLEAAHLDRRRRTYRSSHDARRANRALLELVKTNWQQLQQLQGLDGAPSFVRPVSGRVVGRFGRYEDAVLQLPMTRNGVELRARPNERVRALARGRVVLVSTMPGFEQIVVIDHGGAQYSLTARLWRIEVDEGDTVEPGDVLGRVATKTLDDGLGPTVYLELRQGERPIDPTPYLR